MTISQRLLAVFWIAAGVNHFAKPRLYWAFVPDYLPAHRELVFWSGIAEVVGGVAVIPRGCRRPFARWWLIGVLVAIFPANVHMALNPERYPGIPKPALWARLPMQLLAAWWVWTATRPQPEADGEAERNEDG
jgi:uncharacterized membrane protein